MLTERGRLSATAAYGEVIVDVGGLKVAGYRDPFERRAAENFRDRYQPYPTPAEQDAFTAWLAPLIGDVDVVMVHEPALIAPALEHCGRTRPTARSCFVTGHTHKR